MHNEKSRKFYLAYGSNLSVEQMKHRAPDAKIVGTAILQGWQLVFRQFATIVENPDSQTPVLVWDISRDDEADLDIYEGFPALYIKKDFRVSVKPSDGNAPRDLTAMAYIMPGNETERIFPPKYYYDVLAQGYRNFNFDMAILEQALLDSVSDETVRSALRKRLNSGDF